MKTLIRTVTLVGAAVLWAWVAPAVLPGDDGLGAGLAFFAFLVLAAASWGFWDGLREPSITALLVRWGVVAVVMGAHVPFRIWATEDTGTAVLVSDLVSVTPFVAVLVFAPAAAAVALGQARRGHQRSPA